MIGCLQTRVGRQPIIRLYFEFEIVLKFYNLEAWSFTLADQSSLCFLHAETEDWLNWADAQPHCWLSHVTAQLCVRTLWLYGNENSFFYLLRFSESRSNSGTTPSVPPSVRNTLGCEVCEIFFIQTLPNDCSHIVDVHLLFCAHFIIFFSFLTGVELRHFFHPQCLGGA